MDFPPQLLQMPPEQDEVGDRTPVELLISPDDKEDKTISNEGFWENDQASDETKGKAEETETQYSPEAQFGEVSLNNKADEHHNTTVSEAGQDVVAPCKATSFQNANDQLLNHTKGTYALSRITSKVGETSK